MKMRPPLTPPPTPPRVDEATPVCLLTAPFEPSVSLFCSGPKPNQGRDPQLLAQVHPGGAAAVLPGPAGHLLPLRPPHPRRSGHRGQRLPLPLGEAAMFVGSCLPLPSCETNPAVVPPLRSPTPSPGPTSHPSRARSCPSRTLLWGAWVSPQPPGLP